MRRITAIACALAFAAGASPGFAGECANPNALGTSRTLVIETGAHPRLGAMQYLETLPLADREVVLTFDDGPLPPYSTRILDILAAECVKATYFLVGQMAQNFPELVRRIHAEGHTVGTHSLSHPLTFDRMPLAAVQREVDGGVAAVSAALGDPAALAPFFRIPGLMRSKDVDGYLASRSLITWSSDMVADDWRHISASEVARRALQRIESRGRGIMLLHDIQPATALALPGILRALKAKGYRIVHVVPAGPTRFKTYTEPEQWAVWNGKRGPNVTITEFAALNPKLPAPSLQIFGYQEEIRTTMRFASAPKAPLLLAAAGDHSLPRDAIWSSGMEAEVATAFVSPPDDAEDADWTAVVQTANLTLPEQNASVAWPEVPVAQPTLTRVTTAIVTSKRTGRVSVAGANRPPAAVKRASTTPLGCRNAEVAAAGLTPRCQKPIGHRLSLDSRAPAG